MFGKVREFDHNWRVATLCCYMFWFSVISGMAKARVFKFCTQACPAVSSYDQPPSKWICLWSCDQFLDFRGMALQPDAVM